MEGAVCRTDRAGRPGRDPLACAPEVGRVRVKREETVWGVREARKRWWSGGREGEEGKGAALCWRCRYTRRQASAPCEQGEVSHRVPAGSRGQGC